MNLIAFDYGLKRIGMAVGNRTIATARPLGTVANNNGRPDWTAIGKAVAEWQPDTLIVGLPLERDGSESPLCAHVRGFAKRLRSRFELPVVEVDERFSSVEAQHRIAAMRRRGQKTRRATHADVDAVAAALLLERYFDNDPRADTGSSAGDDH